VVAAIRFLGYSYFGTALMALSRRPQEMVAFRNLSQLTMALVASTAERFAISPAEK
jgi:hypothetical protein